MNTETHLEAHRLLIIDDNPRIHEDIRKILCPIEENNEVAAIAGQLFDSAPRSVERVQFQIDSAFQGQEGLALVERAMAEGAPHSLAFVDVRMPPGWDGIETIRHIWDKYPEIQIVICTAYSDHSWEDIIVSLGHSDNLVILKKPFDNVEVLQLAHALTKKWTLTRQARHRVQDLDDLVRVRTEALSQSNGQLQAEVFQRVETEAALRASEDRFHVAFRAASVPMAILKADTRTCIEVNDGFAALTARTREETLGRTFEDLELLANPADGNLMIRQAQAGSKLRDVICRIRRAGGEIRETLVSLEPVTMGDTACLLLAMQDVTEQRQMEAQYRQSQKMEAVGKLAAGVAHDFNNILTIIHGHTSLQLSRADLDQQVAHSLKQVRMAADRAASLTAQLLAFSRKQLMQRKPVNMTEVMNRLHPLLARMIGETIELENDCAGDLPPVLADEGSLGQVIMNLVVNARDATPPGGKVRISAELVTVDDAAARLNADARSGQFVRVSVVDNGCGMDTSVRARLFEPFFTTKPKGAGTGLGLSMVYGIVKQHEGWVEVESRRNVGSTFRVFLPLSDQPAADSTDLAAAPAIGAKLKSRETILLVEDEKPVREFMSSTLTQGGYKVIEAGDGPEAMLAWKTSKERIHLLLTDMIMPNGISGATLAGRLLRESSHLKVLYTSGYSTEAVENADRLIEGVNFLPKPFDVPKLMKAVEHCLSSETGAPLIEASTTGWRMSGVPPTGQA